MQEVVLTAESIASVKRGKIITKDAEQRALDNL
jgi:hypothetical protein